MPHLDKIYNNLIEHSGYFQLFFLLFAILVGVKKKSFFYNSTLYILLYFLIFDAFFLILSQIFIWVTSSYKFISNFLLEIFNIEDTLFFALCAYFYYFVVLGKYLFQSCPILKYQKYVKYTSWFLLAVTTIDYFFITGYNNYSSFSQTILALYTLIFPMLYLWYIYKEDSKVPLNKNPYFWISLGLLLPNVMTIWLELFGSRLYEEDFVLFCQVSIANSIFYCIGMLLIARGFYFARYAKYLPQQVQAK